MTEFLTEFVIVTYGDQQAETLVAQDYTHTAEAYAAMASYVGHEQKDSKSVVA